MSTTTITTPLPPTLDHSALLSLMHNHSTLIDVLAPGNSASKHLSGDPSTPTDEPVRYEVTALTPIGTNMTYPMTLTNRADGFDSCVEPKPPMGALKISAKWRVQGQELREEVDIEGNFLTKKIAKGNVEKTHPEQHQDLIKRAQGGS